MHVSVDKVDNIEAKVAENIDRLAQIKNELLPIVSSKKFQDMKSLLRELLHYPNCLEELLELVCLSPFSRILSLPLLLSSL